MKVLGIVGSPQRGGRTLVATRALLRGAAESGCDVDEVELANEQLSTDEILERMDGAGVRLRIARLPGSGSVPAQEPAGCGPARNVGRNFGSLAR